MDVVTYHKTMLELLAHGEVRVDEDGEFCEQCGEESPCLAQRALELINVVRKEAK